MANRSSSSSPIQSNKQMQETNNDWLEEVRFRLATPRDIASCFELEKASYRADEAASRSSLQYRQHHAAPYFWCAVVGDDNESKVLGFVCSTRCHVFDESSMSSVHELDGPLLAIHSVVVDEEHRRVGLATRMLRHYVQAIKDRNDGIEKLVLISKGHLLSFYVRCGFSVIKPSDIRHGQDMWFHAEMDIASHKMGHPCWVVDSFTEEAGSGNPAAVVLLSSPDFDDDSHRPWMQSVGREFNLAETAFVWPRQEETKPSLEENEDDESDGGKGTEAHYNIRYITCNGTEVDLCGHATLASASILLQQRVPKKKKDTTICFHARKDILRAKRAKVVRRSSQKSPQRPSLTRASPPPSGDALKIAMDFPRKALRDVTATGDRSAILIMLRSAFSMSDTAENIIYLGIDEDGGDIFIHVTTESFLQLPHDNVDYNALMEWDGYMRGIIICCNSKDEEEVDFFSRFFGPKAGINEDPVTGSAHCALGPYFSAKLDKERVVGKQMSKRGGIVECHVQENRVTIIGSAVTTLNGSLLM